MLARLLLPDLPLEISRSRAPPPHCDRHHSAVRSLHDRLAVDVGTALRTARELRGLEVAQLAAATKIQVHILRAIENNEFDKVPGGIFVRGFIRAYAREVGLDSTEMIEPFLPQKAEALPAATGTEAPLEGTAAPIEPVRIEPEGPRWRLDLGYAVIVPALVFGLVSFNPGGASHSTPTVPPTAPSAAPAAAPPSAPPSAPPASTDAAAGTADASTDALNAVSTSGVALRVEILARGECWVKAVVDGRPFVARLLQPGERVTVDASHDVILRVGDPAVFSYSINGRPGLPLGEARVPVTVRFTSDGRQDALAS